jgi:cytochrome P450
MDRSSKYVDTPAGTVSSFQSLADTFRILRNPVNYLGELAERDAPVIKLNVLGKRYHVFQHPDFIKHVLLEQHRSYYKPGHKLLRMFLGQGLSTTNGAAWLKQRRTMAPAFHRQKLEMMAVQVNDETTKFIEHLKTFKEGEVVNITQEILQFTMSVISRALFNDPLNGEIRKLVQLLEDLAGYATSWMKSPVKIPVNWPTLANNRYRRNVKMFDDIIFGIIDRRRSMPAGTEYHDLLDLLLNHLDDETGAPISDKLLRDEVTTMFMAGHETTAQTLSWIFYHLALQKDILKKLKEESHKVFGSGIPSYQDLSELTYTKQVVYEALRHYPSIWALARITLVPDEVNGVQIAAGETVLLNIYGLHHHPRYWSSPHHFDPSHFDHDAVEMRPPNVFIPFGAGPRMCLGSHFAMLVMQIVVSRVAEYFEFDLATDTKPVVEPNITLRVKDGISLKIRRSGKTA